MSFHTSRRFTRSVPAACGLLVAALAAPAPSCRRGEEGPELGDSVLVVACREPATLDPAFLVGRNETGVVTSLLEGLFRPAADGGLPEPALALSWECAGDDLRCVFHLDPSASWTDGKPVTAGDLVWSWRRVAAAETGSPGAETLHVIRGMAACTAGQGCNPGLRAVDDHTLEVELEYPIPNIPYTFAHARFSPVPRHVVEDLGEAWTEPERFVGNGDYLPVAWRRGVSMTLKAVDGRHAGPRSVELRFTESEDTAFRWFEAGEVDVVEGLVPLDRVPALLRDRPGVVSEAPAAGVFYLAPNLGRPPMDAAALRRALSLALDRELLVETVLGTGQEPAVSLVPGVVARLSGYVPPAECSGRDLAAARRALAGAGHPGGRGLPPVELLYNQSATLTRIMEFIQQ
ncbi:MAG: hypothetical protein FJ098_08805, partial [Deltaproteobacteria bacterium]|nr:hypothetical protein [Deltaproteobacteria bacterium]